MAGGNAADHPAGAQNGFNALALPLWGLLLLVMAVLLVIGCVMETTAALILLVPVLAVLSPQMGVDPGCDALCSRGYDRSGDLLFLAAIDPVAALVDLSLIKPAQFFQCRRPV